MPRYFFDLLNDVDEMADKDGVELSSMDEVRAHALFTIGSILRDEVLRNRSPIHLAVLVRDEAGARVASFRSATSVVASEDPFHHADLGIHGGGNIGTDRC
jgi:hypothetical protein